SRNLDDYRAWFAEQDPESYVDRVLRVANLESVVMTNDPFDPLERPVWEGGFNGDPRFHGVLRIDPLLNDWTNSYQRLQADGYNVSVDLSDGCLVEVRRFLDTWVKRFKALYMAVSLPPDFALPEDSPRARL